MIRTLRALAAILMTGVAGDASARQAQQAPGAGQAPPLVTRPSAAPATQKTPQAKTVKVDINSATKAQLLTLPGVDDAVSSAIIAGRPYKTIADLKTKRVLSTASYNRLSSKIVAADGVGEWMGRVSTGIVAAGGETTGIVLTTTDDRVELRPADPTMRQHLQDLDGKLVTVRGKLETRPGIEVRTRRIVHVTEIVARADVPSR